MFLCKYGNLLIVYYFTTGGTRYMADQKQTVVDADFNAKSSTGMEPKIAVLLAYLFSVLGGLIIFFIEKENKFVKFHALQALILGILEWAIIIVFMWILGIPLMFVYGIG